MDGSHATLDAGPGIGTVIDPADLDHCQRAMRVGSKSFYMASRLLPRGVREATIAVYAFCRLSDDAVDDADAGIPAVRMLKRRLDGIYAGRPQNHPVDRAVAAAVRRHDIPRHVLDALMEGMEWDAHGRRYRSFDDVIAYSVRVAGSVGMLVCCIMGRREPAVLARACDLGVAMQLTNIARDVGEDAARGRIYLPENWLIEAGLDPESWLDEPRFNDKLASVIERLLFEADAIYRRAEPAIAELPLGCRPAIYMARHCYAEIGREVRRRGMDSVSGRAVVSTRRKLGMLPKVLRSMLFVPGIDHDLPHASARALVENVALGPMDAFTTGRAIAWWELSRRLDWTMDLFLKLEVMDRERAGVEVPEHLASRWTG